MPNQLCKAGGAQSPMVGGADADFGFLRVCSLFLRNARKPTQTYHLPPGVSSRSSGGFAVVAAEWR